MRFRNQRPAVYGNGGKLMAIMESWDGNQTTLRCHGLISIVDQDHSYGYQTHTIGNKISTLYKKNSFKNFGNEHSKFRSNNIAQQYVFRARSPSPVSRHHQFAQIANEYSNSRRVSCTSRNNSQLKQQRNNRGRSRLNSERSKVYTFDYPSKITNNSPNIPKSIPCHKPTINHNSNRQKNQIEQITQSIKQLHLPKQTFIHNKQTRPEYQIANRKFQSIKNQILNEIALQNKENDIEIDIEGIMDELKIAADRIINKYHHKPKKQLHQQHHNFLCDESKLSQPTLKNIFSFKANDTESNNIVTNNENHKNQIQPDQSSQQLIKLPEFKQNSKSISSILSDNDPKIQNSLQPIEEIIKTPANKYIMIANSQDSFPINKQDKQIKPNNDIEDSSVASIKVPFMKPVELDNSIRNEINQSLISQNKPEISLTGITNKLANDGYNSYHPNKSNYIICTNSKLQLTPSPVGEIVNNQKMESVQQNCSAKIKANQEPKQGSDERNKSLKVYESHKNMFQKKEGHLEGFKSKQNESENPKQNNQTQDNLLRDPISKQEITRNHQYDYKEIAKPYNYRPYQSKTITYEEYYKNIQNNLLTKPAQTINVNICNQTGPKFMRKENVIKHLVSNHIVEKESNSIEFGVK